MKKVLKISGMSCEHCVRRIERALGSIDGVHVKVKLKENIAVVNLSKDVGDDELTSAVEAAGYDVISIKKG